MNKRILLAVISTAVFASATAQATEPASKEENIGVGAGAIVGAAAGGPVGLIIGAAIGAKIGDEFGSRNDQIDTLNHSVDSSNQKVIDLRATVDSLNSDIDRMGGELQQLRETGHPELAELMYAGVATDLLFRTDEHQLANTTGERVAELARALATMPDVYVQLDGFADERGDETYNQTLSMKRTEHVRDLLVAEGVAAERIKLVGHGESPAVDQNADSYALERRVSMTLFIETTPALASTP